jgi:hypothetical protein
MRSLPCSHLQIFFNHLLVSLNHTLLFPSTYLLAPLQMVLRAQPINTADPGKFEQTTDAPSRGALTTDFLTGSMSPLEYLQVNSSSSRAAAAR